MIHYFFRPFHTCLLQPILSIILIFFSILGISSASKASDQDQVNTPNDTGFYVFFKKPEDWERVYLYTWQLEDSTDELIELHGPWPGQALANASGWYRGFIKQSDIRMQDQAVQLIFNDGHGRKTDDLVRQKNGWYAQSKDSTDGQWYDINPDQKMFEVVVKGGSGSGFYAPGSLVKIEAETQENQFFKFWSTDNEELINDTYAIQTQFQMPAYPVTIAAQMLDLTEGAALYESKNCATCHGAAGEGGIGPSLLLKKEECQSCSNKNDLIQRIELTMPVGNVDSCDGKCAEAISEFILNGLNVTDASRSCETQQNQYRKRLLRLLTEREYSQIVFDLFGLETLDALRFWPEASLVKGYDNNASANIVSDRHALVFSKAAGEITRSFSLLDLAEANCSSDAACIIESAGLKIFRKPVSPTTKQTLLNFLNQNEKDWHKVLEIMLQMPQFLYRQELGEMITPMGAYRLDDYEIASAIAFAVTGSGPDNELLALASKGDLKDKEVRRKQVQRLFQSDKAKANFYAFAEQWLGIGGLPYLTRDDQNFTDEIRRQMLDETKRFLDEKIFNQKASLTQLYLSPETYPSRQLARYYNLKAPAEDGQMVPYDQHRLGLLSQGSIHATYANSHEASPIKRGVFVRNRLLCQDLPPPPANVDTTIPPPAPGLTIRERLKRHISQGRQEDGSNTCYSCHQYIDMVGFGFEAFDQTAKFRAFYPEKPEETIDVSGEIKGLNSLGDEQTISFSNLPELGQKLASSPRVSQCFAIQYFRFASGYVESNEDRCVLASMQRPLIEGASIQDFMEEFIVADSFIYRR